MQRGLDVPALHVHPLTGAILQILQQLRADRHIDSVVTPQIIKAHPQIAAIARTKLSLCFGRVSQNKV